MKGVSIIIAHYDPDIKTGYFRKILMQTINSIRKQIFEGTIEIILCDDGSRWSTKHLDTNEVIHFQKEEILQQAWLNDLDIDQYLYINSDQNYWAIRLKDKAFSLASFDKILILDDDHPFTSKTAVARYDKYLDQYDFVRGRVIGPTGIPHLFSSRNAQGTNYGLKKELYFKFGGYGSYLFENGYGEDDDILWNIYTELTNSGKDLNSGKACFAGDIITKDLASGRWLPEDKEIKKDIMKSGEPQPHVVYFVEKFTELYETPPNKNPSKNRKLWMEWPSSRARISEIYFTPIHYILKIPEWWGKKWKRFIKLLIYLQTREGRKEIRKRITS